MLNKLAAFVRKYAMIQPGEHIICAVSGGADSVALLFALYLLREKMDFSLSAAHFNHHLRGEESDRDEAFVKDFCHRFEIPLHCGGSQVRPGQKGLEAAAREARYGFLRTLPGKIATAHTADDNAETILLHMIRGTGLKGLCGIAPVGENLIRPMLNVTRDEVETFLAEYHLAHIEDSSNGSDQFLRNRLRHHVMPLLRAENPCLAENMTAMALGLQADAAFMTRTAEDAYTLQIAPLRAMDTAVRSRVLERFLKENGVKEPQRAHITLVENLVFAQNPSACAHLPGDVTVQRRYDTLCVLIPKQPLQATPVLQGLMQVPGWRVRCQNAGEICNDAYTFTVCAGAQVCLRPRLSGDTMRRSGGTKSLKKLFIDQKIPASDRANLPVLADEHGVLGVPGIGPNLERIAQNLPAVQFIFEKT